MRVGAIHESPANSAQIQFYIVGAHLCVRPEINARVDLCYDSPSSGNAVSKYGDYTMTYDEIGNPISYKGYSMVWTKAKQLASVSGNGITMSFKYDSNGIRTLKRVNGVDTEFTYAGTTLVSQKTGNEIINFAYTAGGAPYGFTYNGTNYFYLLNLQGDIIGIYDSNGDVVVKYAYDSWGQLMSITGTLADTIGVKNPLRYRGYYYDTETKLYYLQSRYYDPETCHFISMDSYFVAGDYINGMNMYAYCLNNPVMYVDPTGYEAEDPFIQVLEDLLWLLLYASYIEEYAEKTGKDVNAFFDFLGRVVDEDDSLDDVVKAVRIGYEVLNGDPWWLYSGSAGTFLDLLEMSGKYIHPIVGESANAVQLYTSLMADIYNPLMFNDEVTKNMLIHVADIAGGIGISTFSVELGLAVTAATGGNVIVGGLVGFAFYVGGTVVWDEFVNA